MSRDYAVKDICRMMGVSRAGYYKWKNRKTFEKRELTTEPKFLQKKRTTALSDSDLQNVSTFENDKEEKM